MANLFLAKKFIAGSLVKLLIDAHNMFYRGGEGA